MCGEHATAKLRLGKNGGSAPHVRGTLAQLPPRPLACRFSPACAGNTHILASRVATEPVQPRMCGEHGAFPLQTCRLHGSAPHVRGTRVDPQQGAGLKRFSPACAGNTRARRTRSPHTPVQPRMCGEHITANHRKPGFIGSAPHVRGTRRLARTRARRRRFSPACAGNTRAPPRQPQEWPVQPRMCGEHRLMDFRICHRAGSAPHVRGTLTSFGSFCAKFRFSPACAGNTGSDEPPRRRRSVQPRMCGEHNSAEISVLVISGSAPHVRGTPGQRLWCGARRRFSPACAGNTSQRIRNCGTRAVQPRMCGEHVL